MSDRLTIMEEIVTEVTKDLFHKLKSDMPQELQDSESLSMLAKDASDITVFVIQNFMNRFNMAAEELKDA